MEKILFEWEYFEILSIHQRWMLQTNRNACCTFAVLCLSFGINDNSIADCIEIIELHSIIHSFGNISIWKNLLEVLISLFNNYSLFIIFYYEHPTITVLVLYTSKKSIFSFQLNENRFHCFIEYDNELDSSSMLCALVLRLSCADKRTYKCM